MYRRYSAAIAATAMASCGPVRAAGAEHLWPLIQRCDAAAASAADPDIPIGIDDVPFDRIDPKVAVPACEAAAKATPRDRRIAFELAGSYDAEAQPTGAHARTSLRRPDGAGAKGSSQYRKAAALGSSMAQYALCVSEDQWSDTLEWCRQAADGGIVAAMGEYARRSIKVDASEYDRFLTMLKKAATLGDENAKSHLVRIYKDSCFKIKNLKTSAEWDTKHFPAFKPSAQGAVPNRTTNYYYTGGACF